MTSLTSITTAEQLLRAGDIGRCELIRGELVMMSPAGEEHGMITGEIALQVGEFVKKHRLGRVYGAETGFRLSRNPDTVRAPDVAFVTREQLKTRPPGKGFREGAPALAVEVLSPGDTMSEMQKKVQDWLTGGAHQVWVADPDKRTISIYRADRPVEVWGLDATLHANDLLPGFALRISEVFE